MLAVAGTVTPVSAPHSEGRSNWERAPDLTSFSLTSVRIYWRRKTTLQQHGNNVKDHIPYKHKDEIKV